MSDDNLFTAEVFARYGKHLMDVITSIENQIDYYKRSESELEKLSRFKPETYQKELDKIRFKIKEADLKLADVAPRMNELTQKLNDMREVYEANEKVRNLVRRVLHKDGLDEAIAA